MEPGNIVEFIDREKILCAVVLDIKKMRLRLLTENNREVNISASRLSHKANQRLDLSMGRDRLVNALKETASRRKALIQDIDIRELWEVLNTEQEWIDLSTMTQFCFPEDQTADHQAAVIRAFFNDRQYFKFNPDRFFPNTREQVENIINRTKEAERQNRLIEAGGAWLKSVLDDIKSALPQEHEEIIDILKSYYLFENDSSHHELAKKILKRAGHKNPDVIFTALVKLGIWDENENLDLLRFDIPKAFPKDVEQAAEEKHRHLSTIEVENDRKDLTHLPLITIDGQNTLDFDDAISIQQQENGQYLLGIHIADVSHFIRKDDPVDKEARARASSIYMPDMKIPMIPPHLAENLCSLKAGLKRPAISIMIRITSSAEIVDYEIFPSIILVKQQMTYFDVNSVADENQQIRMLYDIAKNFQQKRLLQGAVQITLPEISIYFDEDGKLALTRTDRESPGRLLVAELMILANWLMAKTLAEGGIPAIYRSQTEPRERLYKYNQGSLFQNWMQRKLLSRFVLTPQPEPHCGLGLDAYVTATSPIRKYHDLVTQRQIRAALGLETPYSREEIEHMIQVLEQPTGTVFRIQYKRHRYWLLKYLENRVGEKEQAIVTGRRKNNYTVLLTTYMIECTLSASVGIELKTEDYIQVTIQHVDARKDMISVYLS
ncbi:MAG: VacB/RNase II family 3'-5' exoribonuclease [Deltaproteobacteria bacterium]|nr:VacB/RNase II family 3'-5' exoribonuclease [Deltaproteobacteria bacterium]MBW1960499.1 VacB/RNase II family 3'-5' exoribonuclease [Deltaproteobacteria bacterium]MBW1993152.1 VacB/RNase II family 3'-5' exoribonuclease [Deltaproteobacteria bacterium]MBW2150755.1 VacB/RNase II family 3'-5' exoribonuclease [Deltaproteobacteria bacterium]